MNITPPGIGTRLAPVSDTVQTWLFSPSKLPWRHLAIDGDRVRISLTKDRIVLRSMKDLEDYVIGAVDGRIGQVRDFYFDDRQWVIRYLVVETGNWLVNRKVLISPIAIHHPNWSARLLPVSLTMAQVQNSPHIDTEKPVSRQHEASYFNYYGYPHYWDGEGLWGMGMFPSGIMPGEFSAPAEPAVEPEADAPRRTTQQLQYQYDDPHLRSCQAITGYQIVASDGGIGHIDSLIFDEESWAIRYLVVNTSNWWMGHQVLVSPQWVQAFDWSEQTITIDLSRHAIQESPAYDSSSQLNRQQEDYLYQHYRRVGYWPSAKGDET